MKNRRTTLIGSPRTVVTKSPRYDDPTSRGGRSLTGYDADMRTWLEGGRVGQRPRR